MRLLDGLRRHLDVPEIEERALEGDGFAGQRPPDDLEGLVGSRSTFLDGHAEAFELFLLEADADAELEPAARNDVDDGDVFGEAYRTALNDASRPTR